MARNFAVSTIDALPQRRPAINRHTILQAILDLQKLNGCSVNNLKRYLANQYGVDCQTLDVTIKPIMKMAMDRNILQNLGGTGKVSECKRRRRKSSGGGKKRRKSKGKKGRKSSKGKRSGGKRRRRKSKKAAAAAI